MDVNEIMQCMPHRFPMLLVDRITEYEPSKYSKGIKNVTINEAFFAGHYPGFPIMPGVLIVESMAQCGAVILLTEPNFKGLIPVIGAIDNVKFRKPVVPGDQMVMHIEMTWIKGRIGKLHGDTYVNDELVAAADVSFKLVEGPQG